MLLVLGKRGVDSLLTITITALRDLRGSLLEKPDEGDTDPVVSIEKSLSESTNSQKLLYKEQDEWALQIFCTQGPKLAEIGVGAAFSSAVQLILQLQTNIKPLTHLMKVSALKERVIRQGDFQKTCKFAGRCLKS
ncbi:hypothetical protein TNCV_157111 [Trichonephila clavipes]|nr:hypothetical protein TNCV_157111 [Trichonephila clavipes]